MKQAPLTRKTRHIRLPDLIVGGLLRVDDALTFTHCKRKFAGVVVPGGYIATLRHEMHASALRQSDKVSLYNSPTLFARDCIRVYRNDKNVRDNPLGFPRVFVRRTNQSLADLRVEYVQKFVLAGMPSQNARFPHEKDEKIARKSISEALGRI